MRRLFCRGRGRTPPLEKNTLLPLWRTSQAPFVVPFTTLFLLFGLVNAFAQGQVNVVNQAGYPPGTTPLTSSTTGTTGSVAATLTAAAGRTAWICGFVITSGGTTSALVGVATVTGTLGGTLNFQYVDVSSGQGLLGVAFPQCIPASAQNTNVVVTAPAGGAGTVVAVSAWGFLY